MRVTWLVLTLATAFSPTFSRADALAENPPYVLPLLLMEQGRTVHLELPGDWLIIENTARANGVIDLTLGPGGDSAFRFKAAVIPTGGTDDEAELRKTTAAVLMPELQRQLAAGGKLESIGGEQFHAWFLRATDPRWVDHVPPEGEYRHVIQGTGALGPHTVVFTILFDDLESPYPTAALELLRTARSRTTGFNVRVKQFNHAVLAGQSTDITNPLLIDLLTDATPEEQYLMGDYLVSLGRATNRVEDFADGARYQYAAAAQNGYLPALARLVTMELNAPASPGAR